METTASLLGRPWALAAAIGGFAILAFYLALIVSQGDVEWAAVAVVATFMATASVAATCAVLVSSVRAARWLLRVSAVEFGVLGVLALFSIGVLLIAVAVVVIVAITRLEQNPKMANP